MSSEGIFDGNNLIGDPPQSGLFVVPATWLNPMTNNTIGAGATKTINFYDGLFFTDGANRHQSLFSKARKILYIYLETLGTGASVTVELFKNGVTTGETITIAQDVIEFKQIIIDVDFAQDDYGYLEIVGGASGGTRSFSMGIGGS